MELLEKVRGACRVSAAKVATVVAIAGAAAATVPAQAAPVDVSTVTAGIAEYTGASSPIVLIGGAILLVVLAVKAFGWIRSAMK